jgi:hypothetical protein
LSETSSDAGSDADDVFDLKTAAEDVLPEGYKDLFLYRWQLAARELSENHLREELTLPLDPSLEKQSEIWSRVDEAVVLPTWHCGFRSCSVNSCTCASKESLNHEKGIWQHIWHTAQH